MPPPHPAVPGWSDAVQLRIAGAALYAAAAAALASAALAALTPGLLTPLGPLRATGAALHVRSLWWTLVTGVAASAPAALHAAALRATPVGGAPPRLPAGLPPAAVPLVAMAQSILARLRAGGGRIAAAWAASAAVAATVAVWAACAHRRVAAPGWSGRYGGTVGVLYAVYAMYRNDDVVSFPPLQRRRPLAVKAAVLAVLPEAAALAGAALAVTTLTTHGAPLRVSSGGLAPTAAALVGGLLASITLAAGGAVVRCVAGERIAFAGGDAGDAAPAAPRVAPTPALLAALAAGGGDPLLDVAARHDLAMVAEASDAAGRARRRALFAAGDGDGRDAGRGWAAPVALCLDEVAAALATAAAGLPGAAAAPAPKKEAGAAAPRWNAAPTARPLPSPAASAAADAAAALLPRWTHTVLALRTLAGLAAASAADDALGAAQLGDPNLGAALASLLAAARVFGGLAAACPPPASGRGGLAAPPSGVAAAAARGGDASVAALADVAAVAARRAVTAFGGDAVRALSAASRWPPAGGRGELAADAEAMVAGR